MTVTRTTPSVAGVATTPRDRRRLRGVLLVAGSGAVFGVLAVLVRLDFGPILSLDEAVARSLNGLVAPHPWAVAVLKGVTTLGSAGVLTWLVVLAAILLLTRRRFLL